VSFLWDSVYRKLLISVHFWFLKINISIFLKQYILLPAYNLSAYGILADVKILIAEGVKVTGKGSIQFVLEASTPLQESACHVESDRIACYPAQATFPAYIPAAVTAGTRYIHQLRMKGWVDLEPMHLNDLPWVATEVTVIPGEGH